MQANAHGLDWPNQPLPFKIYTSLDPLPLPAEFERSALPGLAAIAGGPQPDKPQPLTLETLARLCYFSNGITRVLRGMPFRAAACTGALYHIELYPICADLAGLESGVYHYGAHDNALRQLRRGDFRRLLVEATGDEPSTAEAPVTVALTSTWWRNAWKYQARAYRHAFWDSGTILANLLAVAFGQQVAARVLVGFADADINRLLDVDPRHEATICLVALGSGTAAPSDSPPVEPLNLPTRRLSHHEVEYPLIVEAHQASSLPNGHAVSKWRAHHPPRGSAVAVPSAGGSSIENVILRRGSSRHFTRDSITHDQVRAMLLAATSKTPADVDVESQCYVIVNAVDGLPSGGYAFNRQTGALELLEPGDFRREAMYLDLGQELAGDAAINVYWLVDLNELDDRAYRAAQLQAAIEGGKLYLGAYALGLGATGLTFFDDDVTRFFSPHAAGKSVMFLTAVGHPARRR